MSWRAGGADHTLAMVCNVCKHPVVVTPDSEASLEAGPRGCHLYSIGVVCKGRKTPLLWSCSQKQLHLETLAKSSLALPRSVLIYSMGIKGTEHVRVALCTGILGTQQPEVLVLEGALSPS